MINLCTIVDGNPLDLITLTNHLISSFSNTSSGFEFGLEKADSFILSSVSCCSTFC